MPENLCADVTGGIYLNTRTRHLKRTPVLMLDQILKQPFWALILFLGLRITDSGTVGDNGLSIRCDPDKLSSRHKQWW